MTSYEYEIAFRESFKYSNIYNMEGYLICDELKYMRQSLLWGYVSDKNDIADELFDEFIQIRKNEFDKWFKN